MKRTYLAPEEHAYPAGGQTRACRAIYPDGKVRRVWAGIPDTFYTIPAHGKYRGKHVTGFLSIDDKPESPDYGEVLFHIYAKYGVGSHPARLHGKVKS